MTVSRFIKNNIYYLNMSELEYLADVYDIPIHVYIEKTKGILTKTNQIDLKATIIKKIIKYLETGFIGDPPIYTYNMINFNKVTNFKPSSHVFYGQYKSGNKNILKLMKILTNNQFKFGAISNEILRDSWETGKLLTYKQFAIKWLSFDKNKYHPEWKYIEHLSEAKSKEEWHLIRYKYAKEIFQLLKIHYPYKNYRTK